MTDPNPRTDEDKAHRDDKREAKLNPGQNKEGRGDTGATPVAEQGGAATTSIRWTKPILSRQALSAIRSSKPKTMAARPKSPRTDPF